MSVFVHENGWFEFSYEKFTFINILKIPLIPDLEYTTCVTEHRKKPSHAISLSESNKPIRVL